MDWAPRHDKRSSQRLDKELKEKINNGPMRRILLTKLHSGQLIQLMSPPVYVGTKEEIIQKERNDGQRSATGMLLDKVPCYNGWGLAFLDALDDTGLGDIARRLCPDYIPLPVEDLDDENADSGDRPNDDDDAHPPPYSRNDPLAANNINTTPKTVNQSPPHR